MARVVVPALAHHVRRRGDGVSRCSSAMTITSLPRPDRRGGPSTRDQAWLAEIEAATQHTLALQKRGPKPQGVFAPEQIGLFSRVSL